MTRAEQEGPKPIKKKDLLERRPNERNNGVETQGVMPAVEPHFRCPWGQAARKAPTGGGGRAGSQRIGNGGKQAVLGIDAKRTQPERKWEEGSAVLFNCQGNWCWGGTRVF